MNDFEQKHPRHPAGSSKGGQFADKMEAAEKIYDNVITHHTNEVVGKRGLRIPLNAFGKKGSSNTPQRSKEIPAKPQKVYGFDRDGDRDRLNTDHHIKHIKEMGFKDQKEYVRAAIDFWERGQGEIYYAERVQGFYKYDQKSKRFLSIKKDGTIRTFMLYTESKFKKKFLGDRLHHV